MVTALFGELRCGKLQRLAYLGYMVFLAVLLIVLGVGAAFLMGLGEQLFGGELQQAQETSKPWFSIPFMLLFAVVMAIFIYAKLNITAKRIRDIGLPGWKMVLALLVVDILLVAIVSREAASSFMFAILLLLLFVPTAMMVKKRNK